MTEKDHIVPTQVISVAGYSLSVMLLAFACALYLGWLPHASRQADLTNRQKPVPVVKSPDAPAKVQMAKEPEAKQKPEGDALQTPSAQPEPPATLPDEQKPFDSAKILPHEQPAPPPDPLKEYDPGPILLPNVTAQEPPAKQAETETEELPLSEAPEHFSSQDTLTPEDLTATHESDTSSKVANEDQSEQATKDTETADDQKSAGETNRRFASEDTTQERDLSAQTPEPSDTKTKATPRGQANLQAEEPKVRIVTPPSASPPPKPSPPVVIRIAPKPDDELEVLPRPTIVPRDKPKYVQQSERVVIRAPPGSDAETRTPSDAVAVPRTKPFKQQAAKRSEPRGINDQPRRDRKRISADDAPDQREVASIELTPKPQPKPARLIRAPAHTASIAPRKERVEDALTKRSGTKAKPRKTRADGKRVRKHVPPKAKRPTGLAVNTIEGRRGQRRVESRTVAMDQDTYCLAMAIYYEAGRKNLQAQVIVSRDILHRVESVNFPNSVCDVVYQYAHRRGRCRYAFACDGLPDRPSNRVMWHRAKMLAKAQISCGSRCGCYLQKPTLVSSSAGRNRRIIRCQAGYRAPSAKRLSRPEQAAKLQIEPVASRPSSSAISHVGREAR